MTFDRVKVMKGEPGCSGPQASEMGVTVEKINSAPKRVWECKECHELIGAEETVAYHLVDRILYGWCQPCFDHRSRAAVINSEMAA